MVHHMTTTANSEAVSSELEATGLGGPDLLVEAAWLRDAADRLARASEAAADPAGVAAALLAISSTIEQLAGTGVQLAFAVRGWSDGDEEPAEGVDGRDVEAVTRLLALMSSNLRAAAEATRTASALAAPAPKEAASR